MTAALTSAASTQRDSVPPSTAQRAGFCDNPGVDVLVIGGATLIGEQALATFGSC